MPRGRKPVTLESTNFMNVKRRVIMKTSTGKYVVKTDKGLKYAPKVKYYKNPAEIGRAHV